MAREEAWLGIRQSVRGINPLRAAWWLFGNLRWALALIAFVAAVSLLGVLLPQIPASVRGDPVGEAQWIVLQRDTFGPFTGWMHRVGLFDIFHAYWFAVALGLVAASTVVYVLGRLPAAWWVITRPRKRVPDRYFETAPQRVAWAAVEADALEAALRRRWYAVERFQEGKATYLFADRFRWAEMGTILTHAAVVLFILAAVVSRASGFARDILIAEGGSAPVFDVVAQPDQMQVHLLDAVGSFDARGQPLDYRSQLVITQGGQEVKRCVITVNSPCVYRGYRFHQAAYFGFGAEVQVRDLATGNVIYRETLALANPMPAPHLILRDAGGRTVFDETLVLTELVGDVSGRLIAVPGSGAPLWVGLRGQGDGWRLLILEPSTSSGAIHLSLAEGATGRARDLTFEFAGLARTPASFEADFPLPPGVGQGEAGSVLVQMSNAVFGSGDASAGTAVDVPQGQGIPTLALVGLTPQPLSLKPGEAAVVNGYEYTFLGQREFSGLEVKKDPSANLIWLAAGLLLAGLFVTFWVPRRRLWAKITAAGTYLAGQGGHEVGFRREARHLARAVGLPSGEDKEEGEDA
ncbi:MAG TPA: cytochrome c biogenesis protein ResB [Dehalococcoidia bacterium]|nr:cytochrome c biogenesis protein ResB [Dehalococcoidia bacterium]